MLATLLDIDRTLYLWCNRFLVNHGLTLFFRNVSRSGDGYFYAALALLLYFYEPEHGQLFVMTGLFAFLFELPAFIGLKKLIKRDRPFVQISHANYAMQPSDKFSLPSGHTAAAFVMATLISYFYPGFSALAFIWASLIGTSRVMLGVHYPTDIIAGAVLGSCCSLFSIIYLT